MLPNVEFCGCFMPETRASFVRNKRERKREEEKIKRAVERNQ